MTTVADTALFGFLREQIAQRAKSPIADVGENASLNDLGLQSIDAVLVCCEVEEKFDVEIDPGEIFEHETLGGFAKAIAARLKN